MDLRIRRGLALTFIILFALVAPLSIAYGRGYRFDASQRRFSLTGVMVITGFPKRIFASLDGKPFTTITLPHSFRGMFPGDHILRIQSPGYSPQTLTFATRPGETYFLDNLQLVRTVNPSTLRTGLPASAVLSPYGVATAWRTGTAVHIALPTGSPRVYEVPGAARLAWSTDGTTLTVLSATGAALAQFNDTGTRVQEVPDESHIVALQSRIGSGVVLSSIQRIPGGNGWLAVGDGAAWSILDDASIPPELLSRWSDPETSIVHLGRNVTATVRTDGITLRNATTGHVQFIALPNTKQATATRTPGVLHVLTADADLVQWQELQLF